MALKVAPVSTQVKAPQLSGISRKYNDKNYTGMMKRSVVRSRVLKEKNGGCFVSVIGGNQNTQGRRRFGVRASLRAVAQVGQVTEVNKDTFWPIVESAGDKLVVLDMYTQWCGPCKIIAPKIEELSTRYSDVLFLKLDCNQENKPVAMELGVKVVPTFKILKDKKVIKEVTGAKFIELVNAIESVRTSS